MLSPKQLIAETAKFFSLNPNLWTRSRLVRGGTESELGSDRLDKQGCTFCAVGYMAHLLAKQGPSEQAAVRRSPYKAVAKFLGVDSAEIYSRNDSAGSADVVIDYLKGKANAV